METAFQFQPDARLRSKIIPVAPFELAIFGGTGDLALRKLVPALYYRYKDKQIPEDSRIIGVSRAAMTREAYLALLGENVRLRVDEGDFDEEEWSRFARHIDYLSMDVTRQEAFQPLVDLLATEQHRIPVFYLSLPPSLFGPICLGLSSSGLATPESRIVIEKPIGRDLASAQSINQTIGTVFEENQIFRIDHYLGKETVQNLMALRFANSLFEPLWNRQWVDHIQITVAENIGIGKRGNYYDKSGALRDMVQNHLLQLLCLVAMEPPKEFAPDAVRDEKLKVLRSLRPLTPADLKTKLVFGQYRGGAIQGQSVPGYQEEQDIEAGSRTETYVALKAEVDNWRWAGVPFYLRTGKRMQKRTTEIVIELRPVPHLIFTQNSEPVSANRLVIRLQPNEGIRLYMMTKVPGPGGFRMQVAPLNLSFADTFRTRYPDGYERLVMDVVRGNATLFMRRDEVEAAWQWTDTILDSWRDTSNNPKFYDAGTWGPNAAIGLIERDGRTWYEAEDL